MKSENAAHRRSIIEYLSTLADAEFADIAKEARHDKSDSAKAAKEAAAEAVRRLAACVRHGAGSDHIFDNPLPYTPAVAGQLRVQVKEALPNTPPVR